MDLRQYFQRIREVEAGINEPHTFVKSLNTPDGGRAGLITEVSRSLAAKLIVEGRAVLASQDETETFEKQQASERAAAHRVEASRQLQVVFVSDPDKNMTSSETSNPKGSSRK
jgi:hypothetical protein